MGPLVGKAKSNLMELAAEWNQTKIKFFFWEEKKLLSFGLGCFQNLHLTTEYRLVRNPYQTCPEMLSLLRSQTEQLKWTAKRNKSIVRAVGKRMHRDCPIADAPGPRASSF